MNKYFKAFIYVVPVVLILSSLFYLSDISFQLDYFIWNDFLWMLLQIVSPVFVMLTVNFYMARKAQKNRALDDSLE
jgi:hypothetical protein